MKKEIPVNFNDVDFADSEILFYTVNGDNLTLHLKCWNCKIFEIEFLNYVSLFSTNYFRISDFQEVNESFLPEKAIDDFYEVKPKEHHFRIFKFLHDDITTLEIICEDISIKRIEV